MLGRGSADTPAFRPPGRRCWPAADRAYRALGGYARRPGLPPAARANTARPGTRSPQAASQAPRPPGSADEQTTARRGVTRGVALAFGPWMLVRPARLLVRTPMH